VLSSATDKNLTMTNYNYTICICSYYLI